MGCPSNHDDGFGSQTVIVIALSTSSGLLPDHDDGFSPQTVIVIAQSSPECFLAKHDDGYSLETVIVIALSTSTGLLPEHDDGYSLKTVIVIALSTASGLLPKHDDGYSLETVIVSSTSAPSGKIPNHDGGSSMGACATRPFGPSSVSFKHYRSEGNHAHSREYELWPEVGRSIRDCDCTQADGVSTVRCHLGVQRMVATVLLSCSDLDSRLHWCLSTASVGDKRRELVSA